MNRFHQSYFITPENLYSPSYFWIINGRMEKRELERQLEEMEAHGIRSVIFHPFPKDFRPQTMPSDMEPPYMSEEYLEMLAHVMDYAKKLEMNAWLYDEGGWPSGGCCGQVRKSMPESALRVLQKEEDGTFGLHEIPPPADGEAPYVNVIEPGVAERFISLTHEKMLKYCGRHFGKTIKFVFTDEPGMVGCVLDKRATWCSDFAKVFKSIKHYDITPYLPQILSSERMPLKMYEKRIDYFDVRARLFEKRFLAPLRKWCYDHNLLLGGHLNGEDEPEGNMIYGYGNILRSLRKMDVPGVDAIWRQLYPESGKNRSFPMYAASAAHQKGSRYVLSESFAIYGDSMTPDQMKWIVDYQLVRGITVFAFGYFVYQNKKNFVAGLAPDFHSSPFWDYMRPFYNYVARIGSMLGRGTPCTKTAVYYDIRSIWCGGAFMAKAVRLHFSVARKMLANQQEFDFIDDDQLASSEIQKDGSIAVGCMRYTTIVVPTQDWMSKKAKANLEAFEKSGGIVLNDESLDKAPRTCRISGNCSENIRVCKRHYDEHEVYFFTNESNYRNVTVEIKFQEIGPIALCDAENGDYYQVPSILGKFFWTFAPNSSALFMTNKFANKIYECPSEKRADISIDGWTLCRVAEHRVGRDCIEIIPCNEAPIPVKLGDWRNWLPDNFSGKARYAASFVSQKAGKAELNLNKVNYCASVVLNGRPLQEKFFGPFTYNVEIKKGTNTLEIVVANTMANALGDPKTRARLNRDCPPESPYSQRIAKINEDNHESGLFGPVIVRFRK